MACAGHSAVCYGTHEALVKSIPPPISVSQRTSACLDAPSSLFFQDKKKARVALISKMLGGCDFLLGLKTVTAISEKPLQSIHLHLSTPIYRPTNPASSTQCPSVLRYFLFKRRTSSSVFLSRPRSRISGLGSSSRNIGDLFSQQRTRSL
ncbi:hypothetical protein ElyMa_000177600 [Elysia marginata]|uniref:Uncharacterized protein n=1 Tax=Elysia marginata TaxID=1093978 RepID=A0AAV4ETC3_9GAST|nr:hypothetical protein ElyMa_000177600 [Elysia marginata]